MDGLAKARKLQDQGLCSDALTILQQDPGTRSSSTSLCLKAEILAQTGRFKEASAIADSLISTRHLDAGEESTCVYVNAVSLIESGNVEEAIRQLQHASVLAKRGGNLRQLFWCQLKLFALLPERLGRDAAVPLLAELRKTTTLLGDVTFSTALHSYFAEFEAKCGLLEIAKHHNNISRRLVQASSNTWLDALVNNMTFAIHLLRSELYEAQPFGIRAAELAEASGVVTTYRSSLGNLGNLYYSMGDFERAAIYCSRAVAACESSGDKANASLDTLALVYLAQNRIDDCVELLRRTDQSIKSSKDRALYGNRYNELTRTLALERQGKLDESLQHVDYVLRLATQASDSTLVGLASLTKAEVLVSLKRADEAISALNQAASYLPERSPELLAQTHRATACGLLHEGAEGVARLHYARAARIYSALQNVPGKLELDRRWIESSREGFVRDTVPEDVGAAEGAKDALNAVTAVLLYPDRPELIGTELLELLFRAQAIDAGFVVARSTGHQPRVISSVPRTISKDRPNDQRSIALGQSQGRRIELVVSPRKNLTSALMVNAVECLARAAGELRHGRTDRETRSTLWPLEELIEEPKGAVIAGQIREQMDLARRVAKTNVNVLITGESGTGKEILARAIHDLSDRAMKPFVPFNCTAVPRDLLESHLFGHRRGAFTGADRDQPGLIRSAKDGTLFLDEVGEMSLELQPKLLRFLESGEISPLGEPSPVTVNVRVVAATNANLEDAVRDGRFREDLFYRLNVVKLALKPLRERRDEIPGFINHFVARAAEEFKKGQLTVADETLERLLLYRWPGNVRQLQNEIRRMVALAEPDSTLEADAISEEILSALPLIRPTPSKGKEIAVRLGDKLHPTLQRIECEMIKAAFKEHQGRVDAVAKSLGISRKGLYLKRQRLGL